jgi:hypothetical protein
MGGANTKKDNSNSFQSFSNGFKTHCGCLECYHPGAETLDYDYTAANQNGNSGSKTQYPRIRERGEFYIDSFNDQPWSWSFGTNEMVCIICSTACDTSVLFVMCLLYCAMCVCIECCDVTDPVHCLLLCPSHSFLFLTRLKLLRISLYILYGIYLQNGTWFNLSDQAGSIMSCMVWLLMIYSAFTVTMLTITEGIPIILGMLYTVLCMMSLASHAKTSLTDPGSVPIQAIPSERQRLLKDSHSMCGQCQTFKPPGSHHCRICNRCISRMDHHCPWMNNCVGAGISSILFCFWSTPGCVPPTLWRSLVGITFFVRMKIVPFIPSSCIWCAS